MRVLSPRRRLDVLAPPRASKSLRSVRASVRGHPQLI